MLQSSRALIGLLLFLASPAWALADIRLPKIFSDNMVLQRGSSIRIWGTADPDEALEITLGQNTCSVTADNTGKWSAEMVPPETGGPYELAVAGSESRVVFTGVYIGDVWICCGESNMQRSLRQSPGFENDEQLNAWLSEVDQPNIRLFSVPQKSLEEQAINFSEAVAWQECRGEYLAEFSATAYFFAAALKKHDKFKNVPVGLIDVSQAGSTVESWISREAIAADASFGSLLEHWDDNQDKRVANRPASLFNGMIGPIIPLRVRGVIWYQGESNVGRGQQYRTLFRTLINDWRKQLNQGEIPFYYVQLAPYRYSEHNTQDLAEMWDAQQAVLQVPNTGMAGSSDIGNPKQLHPDNKQIVGERLARLAMANTYGEEGLVGCGPLFDRMETLDDESKIRLHFSNSDGLKCVDESLEGFLICGEDGQFKPANAKIEGKTVVVWSNETPHPKQVRYLWDDTARTNLFNGADLPAFPFRTDRFELLSKDIEY